MMLYTHSEIKEKYKSTYQIRKALEKEEIYKIEKGIYSDIPEVNYLTIITKKYPYAVISGYTAYYYHNLTDIIPKKMVLCTKRNATKIHDNRIKQIRMQDKLYELGITTIEYDGTTIKIYDKERLLIDLARNKNQIAYDLYKEIVTSYREIVDLINMKKIEEYLLHFPNADKILEIIQSEVF